jgi:hypothetical protein
MGVDRVWRDSNRSELGHAFDAPGWFARAINRVQNPPRRDFPVMLLPTSSNAFAAKRPNWKHGSSPNFGATFRRIVNLGISLKPAPLMGAAPPPTRRCCYATRTPSSHTCRSRPEGRDEMKREITEHTAEEQLRSYIGRLDPKNQKLIRSVRAAVRKRFPTANELAYDYRRFFVIGYSPTDRGIDSIVAIAARDTGVSLYFSQGPQLPDPRRMLRGSGKQTRFVQVDAASQLAHPDFEALIAATVAQARIPFASKGKGSLIIKSAAAKKRPRRKPAK